MVHQIKALATILNDLRSVTRTHTVGEKRLFEVVPLYDLHITCHGMSTPTSIHTCIHIHTYNKIKL